MKYFSFSAFNTLRSICARLPCFIPEAILLIGCQALLGCGCVAKLLSVNTAQRAHDWASSILTHTHTHANLIGSNACHGLVVVGRKHPFTRYPPLPGPSDSYMSTWLPLSVRWLSQVCNYPQITASHHHPGSKLQDGSQTLIVCSNNICTFHIMAVLKSSLCSKCSGEVRGSLSPERPPQVMPWDTWYR